MKLAPQAKLDQIVAEHPSISESRKLFLIDYLDDLNPARLPAVIAASDPAEAAFMRACTEQTQLAA